MVEDSKVVIEPAQALSDIVLSLETLKISYFLVGSFASGIRGEFRATNDIDLVCKITGDMVKHFSEGVAEKFFCDDIAAQTAIKSGGSFNLIHRETVLKIDIFTKIDKFEAEEFSRASYVRIPYTTASVNVSTVEYNILAKLRWYLMSNRQLERQLQDVRAMIAINRASLDSDYLYKWADSLGLMDLLNSLL